MNLSHRQLFPGPGGVSRLEGYMNLSHRQLFPGPGGKW